MYVLFVSNNALIYDGFNISYATIKSKPLNVLALIISVLTLQEK